MEKTGHLKKACYKVVPSFAEIMWWRFQWNRQTDRCAAGAGTTATNLYTMFAAGPSVAQYHMARDADLSALFSVISEDSFHTMWPNSLQHLQQVTSTCN